MTKTKWNGRWRKISTAPKEPLDKHKYGPELIMFVSGRVGIGFWDADFDNWYFEHPEHVGGLNPTHWMPMPPTPR